MNMQNVPKYLAGWNLKKLFIPDNDNYLIVNVDYKGAEVRVFTAYARDEALIKALNDGLDMHSFFAAQVFKRPYEMYARRDDATFIPDKNLRRLLDVERSNIKRVVFGILYGAGPEKISETIGVSVEEAKALIGLLYQMFPEIQKYAEIVEMEVAQNHFVDTHFGRRRRFPLAAIARHAGRAKRQGRNFKIQSTSSDIVLGQLIEMDAPLRSEFGGRMLLTVHDSLVFQFPKKYIHQLRPFVKEYAEARVTKKYPWLPVPFAADVEVGDNYGECQSIDKYVAQNPIILQEEGIVEEHELLTELRLDAFEAA
jgi:DNA polymerase-1